MQSYNPFREFLFDMCDSLGSTQKKKSGLHTFIDSCAQLESANFTSAVAESRPSFVMTLQLDTSP